jgi:hypothetical protein
MGVSNVDSHHEVADITDPGRRPRVVMVVANPTTSTTLGWPVGFWAAELFHPYYEFSQKRYAVTIASPDGGRVEMDALSDPRDDSKWSADDLISMGAVNTPEITALLAHAGAERARSRRLRRDRRLRRAGADVPVPRRRGPQARDRALLRGQQADRRVVSRHLRPPGRQAL